MMNRFCTACSDNGLALEHVPKEKLSKKVILAAVSANGLALQHVPKEKRSDDIILAAVDQNGLSLEHVDLISKDNHIAEDIKGQSYCIKAVQQNCLSLQFVPSKFQNEEIVIIAINQEPTTFKFVSKELLKKNFKIIQYALEQDAICLNWVPQEFFQTKKDCLLKIFANHKILYS
jgi:hypothetical protein